jgi:ABC-type transporter MlaC component
MFRTTKYKILLNCFLGSMTHAAMSESPKITPAPILATNGSSQKSKTPSKGQTKAEFAVMSLYESAKSICQNSKTSEQEMRQLKKLVESSWEISKIAQYVIWPHWKLFSKSQKQEFISLLTDNVVRTFSKVSRKYLSYLKITKVTPIRGKNNASDVYCEVVNKDDGLKVEVRFQIVGQLVRNLFVEKLDLVAAKKMDYTSLMRKNRNSIPEFLKALQKQSSSRGMGNLPSSKGK